MLKKTSVKTLRKKNKKNNKKYVKKNQCEDIAKKKQSEDFIKSIKFTTSSLNI